MRRNGRPTSAFFPPAEAALPEGLIGLGGRLTSEWLLDAYRHGIFPWPFNDGELAWWSPDPRAIIEFDLFHVPRSLARARRGGRFEITLDRDFRGVIDGCATAGGREDQTWITPGMREAYARLHDEGYGHSVEAWYEGELAGGVYGLAIGGLFAAESMFYRVSDASKLALAQLVDHLRERGFVLLDIQQITPNTSRFGAIEISRRDYLKRLSAAVDLPVSFDGTASRPIAGG